MGNGQTQREREREGERERDGDIQRASETSFLDPLPGHQTPVRNADCAYFLLDSATLASPLRTGCSSLSVGHRTSDDTPRCDTNPPGGVSLLYAPPQSLSDRSQMTGQRSS